MSDIMKVEVVSREIIKPSSPTPNSLKSFNLSVLDQLSPPFHVPLILYYPINDDNSSLSSRFRCDLLKKSLAETLTKFYPFAGRVNDNMVVDCNDDGVEYSEARVSNCRLEEFIQNPNFIELEKPLLPFDPLEDTPNVLLAIQVNIFEDCGGIAIALCFSHKIADASSLATFVTDWSSLARGATEEIKGPVFELASLFPAKDVLKGFVLPTLFGEEGIVTKKFVFEPLKIDELKKKALSSTTGESDIVQEHKPISRVEAVTALIWRCFIDLDQSKNEGVPVRVYVASYSVNMRSRIVPPLSSNSIGNMETITAAVSMVTSDKKKDGYPNLVSNVQNAIKKINSDHVKELQTTDALLNNMKMMGEQISSGQTVNIHFSSWCRFSFYEADFGWGKPICLSICKLPFKNLVFLCDTSSGNGGIEAWVSLSKEDMAVFERDEELLAFVS